MNDTNVCERAPDLMAFLYHEMNERETREFELHLQQCGSCREELSSFGMVRESITAWRDEALSGFVSTPAPLPAKKSALAALRQFFDLSPLWLKAATGFAVLAFCVLAAALFVVTSRKENSSNHAVYTQQQVDRLVADALAQQQPAPVEKAPESEPIVAVAPPPQQRTPKKQATKDRRPLSRAEREQLAADLRLLTTDDDALDLLGDRINE
ncbi:MAG TPA: zf-HC2 domain-containing protein [Pyrinomonadaceae bacterium]|nr:zf-HC2 domain-containing protein [Pyrinomonadaceae bacterium]